MATETKVRLSNTRSAALVVIGSLFVACGFFIATTLELIRHERIERMHFIDMANAFTQTFAETRNDENPVPATFRRMGMEQFNELNQISGHDDGVPAFMRMPGLPGLELEIVEKDPRLRDLIQGFVDAPDTLAIHEQRIENGNFVARTLVPSIATRESCVVCHNQALNADVYELGDVMGAFIVETDLTHVTWRNMLYSFGAFVIALFAGRALARREQRRMVRVVKALEGQVEVEKKQRAAVAYASFLASHDALTGLSNRNRIMEKMDDLALACFDQKLRDVFFVIIDLDDFKSVNDTMGHDAGDALLTAVASRIKHFSVVYDGLAARLGGDEFALVVPAAKKDMSPDWLGAIILEALAAEVAHCGYVITPKASIGIAALRDHALASVADLMKAADIALYETKVAGKNGYRVFDQLMRESMGRRSRMAADLPAAIKNGDIRLVLQPQMDLGCNRVIGFEALARWRWNDAELSPQEFVKVAEEAGLILGLDLAVFRQACRFSKRVSSCFGVPVRISSNISGLDFSDPSLCRASWHCVADGCFG